MEAKSSEVMSVDILAFLKEQTLEPLKLHPNSTALLWWSVFNIKSYREIWETSCRTYDAKQQHKWHIKATTVCFNMCLLFLVEKTMEMQRGQKTEQPDFTMFDSAAMLHPFLINSILTGGLREKKKIHIFRKKIILVEWGHFLLFHSFQTREMISCFLLPSFHSQLLHSRKWLVACQLFSWWQLKKIFRTFNKTLKVP